MQFEEIVIKYTWFCLKIKSARMHLSFCNIIAVYQKAMAILSRLTKRMNCKSRTAAELQQLINEQSLISNFSVREF